VRLRQLATEAPWVEFKENFSDTQGIGEYISALANSAALEGVQSGFMVWGIRDQDHAVAGTNFNPATMKVGNEDFLPWATRLLDPQIHFGFEECQVEGKRVVLMRVAASQGHVTKFAGTEYIRIGSYKKKLKDHREHERRLWKAFDSRDFESLAARDHLSVDEVVALLDYPAFFSMGRHPLPENRSEIIEQLEGAGLTRWSVEEEWVITNLGALLLARDWNHFPSLERKAARVVQYRGTSRVTSLREQTGTKGYAAGFEGLLDFVMALSPADESIDGALRENRTAYPELAMRELLANMLVHQNLSITGSGPLVEIFEDRMEITNPGVPLIDKTRFLDHPPISRNEKLAKAMRQMRICEERGSGWDKVAFEIEINQLPAPLIETTETHTRVVVYGQRSFRSLGREERLRALYLHACLNHVQGKQTTNATVRDRFGLKKESAATASRLIKDAVAEGLLAPYDAEAGKRAMRYVPGWAAS
jgi:predicted HTH transcriptional regulator